MKNILLVFIGGGMGSILRYIISKALNKSDSFFPYGTFTANILGSLIIGFILGLLIKNQSVLSPNQSLLLVTGFCGGFTTFSTFAYENQQLIKSGDFLQAGIYTVLSFLVAIISVYGGIYASRWVA